MGETTKAKINLKEGTIELEGSESFVSGYLNEFKELLKAPQIAEQQLPPPAHKAAPQKAPAKKAAASKTTQGKKAAPKVSIERFDIHGGNDVPSLSAFMEEKKPGTGNGNIIAVMGFYITDLLGNDNFTEGQIEYAYKMLKLKRPAHLRQIMINEKNKRDLFEADAEDSTLWSLTRTGEIYVSDMLPES
ncbi:hypothetical protein G8770_17300 [Aestuariicella hydrocarbonica]|uniref:Uncharacterized protein n=1 Tax=Pseudomaricurvus hydrocarbonicus TaxID=1470433 RepID=A0A9E5T3N0_9GAMM|nr:hypothetical protein [Aestuariicella hydrocarbonica]NHO67308.1 hypothetical protein [Aestuariicella hydrocarbonica]